MTDMVATRYHYTPTGTYDELLIVPGKFEVGEVGKGKEMLRVTRVYVSERGTLWNGRHCFPFLLSLSLLLVLFVEVFMVFTKRRPSFRVFGINSV